MTPPRDSLEERVFKEWKAGYELPRNMKITNKIVNNEEIQFTLQITRAELQALRGFVQHLKGVILDENSYEQHYTLQKLDEVIEYIDERVK